MKKIMSVLILAFFLSACNNSQKTNEVSNQSKESTAKLDKDALYGDLYRFYTPNPQSQFEKDQNAIIEYCADRLLNPKRTPSGFFMLIEQNGKGPIMRWGDPVKAHYKGYFLDDKVFDSSYQRGEPMAFRVGQMIKAWNDALMMVGKGTKLKLFVPSDLAYGADGFPGYVPPYTPLIFEIEVLED